MKQTRNFLQGLVGGGIALAMVTTLMAQTPEVGVAKVVRIKGSARYTVAGGAWQPLKVGAALKPGSIIQTGLDKGSYVDVVLGDGAASISPATSVQVSPADVNKSITPPNLSYAPKADQNVVRLWENTVLGIDKLTSLATGADVVTETQLDLKAGHIIGSVKKMSAASKYEIKLPKGVAGIRGTWYDLTADGLLKVVDGSVVLAWVKDDGTVLTQVVNSSQQFDAPTGQLTPLSVGDVKNIETVGSSMRVAMGGGVTTFAPDMTVQFVSGNKGKGPPPGRPKGKGKGGD